LGIETMIDSKCTYLQAIFGAMVVVVILIGIVYVLIRQGVGVTEVSLIKSLIEKEQAAIGAAERMRDISTNPIFLEFAETYIQNRQEVIGRLEGILAQLETVSE